MADNIVSSLFGLSPDDVRRQQYAQLQANALAMSRMGSAQQANYYGGMAGGQIGGMLQGAMGIPNKEVEAAKQREAALQGADLQTPEGLRALAAKFQSAGMQQQAMIAAAKANEMDKLAQNELLERQRQSLAERKQEFQETEAFEFKKQQAKDALEARMEQARMRSEDARLSADQRAEAAKEANATRLQIAQLMASMKQSTSGRPSDKLLNKDQRWVQKDGEFVAEIIPGSKTYNVQKGAYSADKDAVKTVQDSYESSKSKIDVILADENKSAFGKLFGGYAEKFAGQYLSGKTASVKQKLESLKSEMKAAGLQIMRSGGGVGQITEREWKIMESMIDSLDPTMDEDDARGVLKEIGTRMESAKNRAESKFNTEWSGSQFDADKPTSKGGVKFLGFE